MKGEEGHHAGTGADLLAAKLAADGEDAETGLFVSNEDSIAAIAAAERLAKAVRSVGCMSCLLSIFFGGVN